MRDAPACTVAYRPLPYGEIVPSDSCRHNPVGGRMDLGVRLVTNGKGRKILKDGWFCMQCGSGEHVHAENWIDLWWFAWKELKGKCPEFDYRLTELAEAAIGGEFHAFMDASVALWNRR